MLQLEFGRMLGSGNEHLFMDISTIDCRDTNISFSVENLLNNQYYSARPPQKIHPTCPKDTPSRRKPASKDQQTPRPPRKEASKQQQRQSRQPSKHRDANDEKDTYDSSQTVKIAPAKPLLNDPPAKRNAKHTPTSALLPTASSKKFQPSQQPRSRSNSNASQHADRRWSHARQDWTKPLSSNISTRRPSLEKMRSQTNRAPTEEAKARNEHIVRNDYFDEKGKAEPKPDRQKNSSSKRPKKTKKPTQGGTQLEKASSGQWEKLNPKSPRLKK